MRIALAQEGRDEVKTADRMFDTFQEQHFVRSYDTWKLIGGVKD